MSASSAAFAVSIFDADEFVMLKVTGWVLTASAVNKCFSASAVRVVRARI